MTDMVQPILAARRITKSFFGVQVLKGLDFTLNSGEIMGLIGENGAGKSTLMKIIAGLYTFDDGEILYGGKSVRFNDPGESRDVGIAIIHQEFNLFSNLSVAENIFLNREEFQGLFGRVRWKRMYGEARRVLGELGAKLDVAMPVRLLSVREQQLVEIAKAVSTDAKVLIMDEPSAALPDNEVQHMFDLVRILKRQGVGVVYISHRMQEVTQICDRVTILRDGVNVGVKSVADTHIDQIIALMVGREINDYYPHSAHAVGDVMLEVNGVGGEDLPLNSLKVHSGEVVGLYGLAGSGSTELAEMIMGLRPTTSGSVRVGEKPIRKRVMQNAMESGIAYVPPDRRKEGVIVELPVNDNIILANMEQYTHNGVLVRKKIEARTRQHIDSLSIKCSSQTQTVNSLSGGNQQKVVLGKWLDREPTIMILNEPTRGVDVGAKSEIYKLIDQLASRGMAILLISSEVP